VLDIGTGTGICMCADEAVLNSSNVHRGNLRGRGAPQRRGTLLITTLHFGGR
jgi:hypothetical protein